MKRLMTSIENFSFEFPENAYKIKEMLALIPKNEQSHFQECGIEEIRTHNNSDSCTMAVIAAKKLLAERTTNQPAIDLVVYIQPRAPQYLMSSELTYILEALALSKVYALTITDFGCVNISYALELVRKFLQAKAYQCALLLTGSSPYSINRFRYPVTIIGDAGMAMLLTQSNHDIIVDQELDYNGKYWDLFYVDYKNNPSDQWNEECKDLNQYSFKLALESRLKFNELINNLLTRNNLKKKDIAYYLMQNISNSAYQYYEECLDIEFHPCCKINLKHYGHLGSIDIMLNYHSLLRTEAPRKGDKIIILNNSPVAAWSVTLIEH